MSQYLGRVSTFEHTYMITVLNRTYTVLKLRCFIVGAIGYQYNFDNSTVSSD